MIKNLKVFYCLVFAICNISYAEEYQVTVSNDAYIRKKIEFLTEKSDFTYDQIKKLFKSNPEYNVFCYIDKKLDLGNSTQAIKTFADLMPFSSSYITKFKINEDDLGFDLKVTNLPLEGTKVYEQTTSGSVDCVGSNTGCSGLVITDEKMANIKVDQTKTDTQSADISLRWQYFIESKKRLYAEMVTSFSTKKYNFIGSPKGSETLANHYLCVLDLRNEEINL